MTGSATQQVTLRKPTDTEVGAAVVAMKGIMASGQRDEMVAQGPDAGLFFALDLGLSASQPATIQLFDVIDLALAYPLYASKVHLSVNRPSAVDPTVAPVLPVSKHQSFPSGHASYAYALATVLADLCGFADPGYKTRVFAIAERISTNRERAGLHTALDTDAGRKLGSALGSWLVDSASDPSLRWHAMYERAKLEWTDTNGLM